MRFITMSWLRFVQYSHRTSKPTLTKTGPKCLMLEVFLSDFGLQKMRSRLFQIPKLPRF